MTGVAVEAAAETATRTEGSAKTRRGGQKAQPNWSPPNVDAPLPSVDSSTVCPLSEVLEQAGQRAQELVDNLQSFTARETVDYEQTDDFGVPVAGDHALFEYAVGFDEHSGGLKVTEARTPVAGSGGLPQGFRIRACRRSRLFFIRTIRATMKCGARVRWKRTAKGCGWFISSSARIGGAERGRFERSKDRIR